MDYLSEQFGLSSLSFGEALKRATSNEYGTSLGRDKENRLEPACWPNLSPSFQIHPSDRVFTIGSCFARNIERALISSGVNVPVAEMAHQLDHSEGSQILNKYTPPGIFQEIDWALRVGNPDNLTEGDVSDLFFRMSDGRVIDMHLHSSQPAPFEAALERRKAVARIFQSIRSCDVAIITLGYIEVFFDTTTNLFLNMTPSRPMAREKDRFRFARLNYQTSLDYVQRAIRLLNDIGISRVLITTSPVPLLRTFTDDDIIVANMFSKSTLRTVAGTISDEIEGVDYFPSYESVILTKSPDVWNPDLIHVSPPFVAQIMARVKTAYMRDSSDETVADMIAAASTGRMADARSLYLDVPEPLSVQNFVFHAVAAEMLSRSGNVDIALKHALSDAPLGREHQDYVMRAAAVARKLGRVDEAAKVEAEAIESADVAQLSRIVDYLNQQQRYKEAVAVIEGHLEHGQFGPMAALRWLKAIEAVGGPDGAIGFLQAAFAASKSPDLAGALVQRLKAQGRWRDLVEAVDAVREPHRGLWLEKRAALTAMGKSDQAEQMTRELERQFTANLT